MIIQCPQCKTQARLPESQEGAKVRCSECERVYVATPFGAARSSSKSNPLPIYLTVGGGLIALVIILVVMNKKPDVVTPVRAEPAKEAVAEEPTDYTGWNSAPVKAVRDLHRAALAYDESKLRGGIDGKRTWQRVQANLADLAQEEPVEGAEPIVADARAWSELAQDEQAAFMSDTMESLMRGDAKDLVADWKPYDGKVVEENDIETVVEVSVVPAEDGGSTESRTVLWKLVKIGERWKAYSWERFYTQAELAEIARNKAKRTKKTTLSDGSVVFEGEPGPVEHFEETPMELRAELDGLYATLIDLELPGPKNAAAKRALVAIGRPALPVLLTGLYLIPLDTEDHAIQLNLINQTLEEITGHYTTFKPMVDVGSGVGTSEERRQSGIKQWFGWYNRKGKKFVENMSEDLIDTEFKPRNAAEQRDYERALREQKAQDN